MLIRTKRLRCLLIIGTLWIFASIGSIFCAKKPKERKTPQVKVECYSPKTGEVLSQILTNAHIPQNTQTQIIARLKKINFNFKSLNPNDTLKFFYQNDTLVRMEIKKNYATIYCLDNLISQNISVSMKYLNVSSKVTLVKGVISSSLYESMLKIGEQVSLIANYADILAWEIDFFTETHTGDSFFVLVEKKFLDSTCVDYGRIYALRYQGKIGDISGFYYIDASGYKDYYDFNGNSLRKAFLKSPLRYSYISSHFSKARFHPILKVVRPHRGIDYVAPSGAPVSAIGDGVITFVGWKNGYGRFIEIQHSQRFSSRYGHLQRYAQGIGRGKRVKQGQIIGYVGATGLATGPHLHFELLKNGQWVNPIKIIPPRADPVKPAYLSDFKKHRDSLLAYIKNG
ncbi:MAG: M23 family metallopeptidase [candidate division WOR-3 bacterium]